MFNKKINRTIKALNSHLDQRLDFMNTRYHELRGDFDRLVIALGLEKNEIHKIEYVKKGGPEQ